jgi:recombination protein RecT
MTNLPAIRKTLTSENMQATIRQRIGQKAGTFTTSLLDVIGDTPALQQCDPALVVKEALKAAALDLPINKNLGFAYVIPYNESRKDGNKWIKEMRPSFQMGYKGFIQLAIRTGQFKHLNAGVVYKGEEMVEDRIKGTVQIFGERTGDKVVGYFAYMQLVNGFEKAVAWTADMVVRHAEKFSKSYSGKSSPWKTDFDAMAKKTMILQLKNYMPMTIEMSQAMAADFSDTRPSSEHEADNQANQEYIDIEPVQEKVNTQEPEEPPASDKMTDEEKAEIREQEAREAAEAPY